MGNPLARAAELLTGVVVVTGTDTDVGKTYATAALALAGCSAGRRRIAVYKPVQTGVLPGDSGDIDDVARLLAAAGVPSDLLTTAEGQRLSAPMAPPPAAAIDQVPLLNLDDHAERVAALLSDHDLVLVEGSGGVLVELDGQGRNIADLTERISRDVDPYVGVVLVGRPDLGTLNHTLLSLEALYRRECACSERCWVVGPRIRRYCTRPIATTSLTSMRRTAGASLSLVPSRRAGAPWAEYEVK